MNTNTAWEIYAKQNPYWAVLTDNRFLNSTIDDDARHLFFASGDNHMSSVHNVLKTLFNAPKRFIVSVDFGCGVGRLLRYLSTVSDAVIGIDISPTMREIASANMTCFGINNVSLISSDDSMTELTRSFDFLHSVIVLQHIPPKTGIQILNSLLSKLQPGGFGYLQLTFANAIQTINIESSAVTGDLFEYYQRTDNSIQKLVPRPSGELRMQMNHYNLNEIMCLFHKHHINNTFVRHSLHQNCLGLELFFNKQA